MLGDIYRREGCTQKAIEYYELAAEKGDVISMCELGRIYLAGEEVEQDFDIARKWFEKGAENNDAISLCYLAAIYYFGNGVKEDIEKAEKLFRKAAELGSKAANELIEELFGD